MIFWMLSRFAITSGKVGKRGISVNVGIVKKHDRYRTLYELPLPENIINNIYGFTYRCWTCEKTIEKEEALEERLKTNDLCLYDVDKLILSLERIFPLYDSVKHVITNITMKRYNMFKKLFDAMMYCRGKEKYKHGYNTK